MGTYTQFHTAARAGDFRRVTWICGDQPVLIEEVIDTIRDHLRPSELDRLTLHSGPTFDRDVWATANQHLLNPGSNRMILIRDADRLTRWDQLTLWLTRTRQLPGVYLVFVSNDTDLPASNVNGRKTLKPHIAQIKAPRGSLVRCTLPTEADTLAWIRRRATMDDHTARYLLTRTGGNLTAAAAVCAKLNLFDTTAGKASIDALVNETPAADLADSLIAADRRRALLAADRVTERDLHRLIALLDSRLDLLQQLHRNLAQGSSWRDNQGINPYLVRQYQPYARDYDPRTCARRRRVLAVIDDAIRNGAHIGLVEALIALW